MGGEHCLLNISARRASMMTMVMSWRLQTRCKIHSPNVKNIDVFRQGLQHHILLGMKYRIMIHQPEFAPLNFSTWNQTFGKSTNIFKS